MSTETKDQTENGAKKKPLRIPEWFKQSKGKLEATRSLSKKLEAEIPDSICQEARCPNRSECFAKGVLTFMIMGTVCTRRCAFCSVAHGKPLPVDEEAEAQKLIRTIDVLNLRFVVITSPNRDDLKDGGASHYAHIIRRIKETYPEVKVEVLIPDLKGKVHDLQTIMDAKPDVVNHNLETVPSLYTTARRGSLYKRSMQLLREMKVIDKKVLNKTGLMVGLGETKDELKSTFKDIAESGVDILTLGQYLKPDKNSLDVQKYYHPDEFDELKEAAQAAGIRFVFSGPLVRSSYLAENVFDELQDGESVGDRLYAASHS